MQTITSGLIEGGKYLIKVPDGWDGTLVLYSQGPPAPPDDPVWNASHPIVHAFLDRRYAVAGWASPTFWPLEQSFVTQALVLDEFSRKVAEPERTIAYGQSIGGIITAGLVQRHAKRLSGALPVCGPIAGGVATHNRELDIGFTFKTLIAPDSGLQVVRISDGEANLRLAFSLLHAAAEDPQGRARIALTAAIANVPGSGQRTVSKGGVFDAQKQVDAQIRWYRDIVFLVIFSARATIEHRAGGNPSWNTDADYRAMFERSINRELVETLYREASLDLEADLDCLANAPRVAADPESVRYLEKYVVFDGNLAGTPVVTVHTSGDGLCTPDHERAYGDVVSWAGHAASLRQLWITRSEHCSFTVGEILVAMDVLRERINGGAWPTVEPAKLNAAAAAMGPRHNTLSFPGGQQPPPSPQMPGFNDFVPWPFPRPYDVRMTANRHA